MSGKRVKDGPISVISASRKHANVWHVVAFTLRDLKCEVLSEKLPRRELALWRASVCGDSALFDLSMPGHLYLRAEVRLASDYLLANLERELRLGRL